MGGEPRRSRPGCRTAAYTSQRGPPAVDVPVTGTTAGELYGGRVGLDHARPGPSRYAPATRPTRRAAIDGTAAWARSSPRRRGRGRARRRSPTGGSAATPAAARHRRRDRLGLRAHRADEGASCASPCSPATGSRRSARPPAATGSAARSRADAARRTPGAPGGRPPAGRTPAAEADQGQDGPAALRGLPQAPAQGHPAGRLAHLLQGHVAAKVRLIVQRRQQRPQALGHGRHDHAARSRPAPARCASPGASASGCSSPRAYRLVVTAPAAPGSRAPRPSGSASAWSRAERMATSDLDRSGASRAGARPRRSRSPDDSLGRAARRARAAARGERAAEGGRARRAGHRRRCCGRARSLSAAPTTRRASPTRRHACSSRAW